MECQLGTSEIWQIFKQEGCDPACMDIFEVYGRIIEAGNSDEDSMTYTLTRRYSHTELVARFAKQFKTIQDEFFDRMKNISKEFAHNYAPAIKIDNELGVSEGSQINTEEDGSMEVVRLKDGTRRLNCPVHLCKTATFKLRRHLKDIHKLTEEKILFAMNLAHKMELNKDGTELEAPTAKPKTSKVVQDSATSMVSRKSNYKECCMCEYLYINITDHLKKTHKMKSTDNNYYNCIANSKVVPLVYTKLINGRRVKLEGDQLKAAKNLHSKAIDEQRSTLQTLKSSRETLENLRVSLSDAKKEKKEATDIDNLNEEYQAAKKKYYKLRYPEKRQYTSDVASWVVSYTAYLEAAEEKNPLRLQRMATDIISCYEKEKNMTVSFKDISEPLKVKEMLQCFRKTKNISSVSKIKYIGQFSAFLNFLFLSSESPEKADTLSRESLSALDYIYSQTLFQIKSELKILHKLKGTEIIKKKKIAKQNIITDEEIKDVMETATNYLTKIDMEINDGTASDTYGRKEAISVRNALMAVATLRLGRRSLELTRMNMEEVKEATETVVNGRKFFIIDVATHKNTGSGKPSPIAFTELEFRVLNYFTENLRGKYVKDASNCEIAFPPQTKLNTDIHQRMTVQGARQILSKFKISSGKSLGTRLIRKSKVTNSRNKSNTSEETINHLAASMNHSRRTADSHYDLNSLHDSVAHVLAIECSPISSSTPVKLGKNTESKPCSAASSSYTTKTTSRLEDSISIDKDEDVTIRNLRSKKIKMSETIKKVGKEKKRGRKT